MDTDTTITTVTAVAPTNQALRRLCESEHANCFACRPLHKGGLGLEFSVQDDGSVLAEWSCPPDRESYPGIAHGGILATVLDSAMVHALFSRGIVARTGELKIRYHHSVPVGQTTRVRGFLREDYAPLFYMEADISTPTALCVHAQAKFMGEHKPIEP